MSGVPDWLKPKPDDPPLRPRPETVALIAAENRYREHFGRMEMCVQNETLAEPINEEEMATILNYCVDHNIMWHVLFRIKEDPDILY